MTEPGPPTGSVPPPGGTPPPPPPPDPDDRYGDGEGVAEPPPPRSDIGEMTPAPWGPRRALGGLGLLLGLLILESALIAVLFDPELDTLASRLVLQAALAGTLVAVAYALVPENRAPQSQWASLGLRPARVGAVGAAVLSYLAYVGCALVIAALLSPEQEDVTRDLGADEGIAGAVIAGILVVVVAPISEEIFFRGFGFAGLRRSMSFAAAALLSAGALGSLSLHRPGVLARGASSSPLFGVILCRLYERTGSIWPTIAVHAFNNGLAFILLTA